MWKTSTSKDDIDVRTKQGMKRRKEIKKGTLHDAKKFEYGYYQPFI